MAAPLTNLPPQLHPVPFALRAAWRSRVMLALLLLAGLGVGVFRAATTQNTYRSIGKLYVRPSVTENLTAESAIVGTTASRLLNTREAISNELQMLATPQLYQKAITRVGADGVLSPYSPLGNELPGGAFTGWFHQFQQWWFRNSAMADRDAATREYFALQVLQETLVIFPEANTTVLNVQYQGNSPQQAKQVVDAVLAAAIDVHNEVLDSASNVGAVRAELVTEEERAVAAESALLQFRREREIYDYDAQRAALIAQIEALARQEERLQADIRRHTAERVALTQILATVPERQPLEGQATVNPEFTRLTNLLASLMAEDLNLELGKLRGADPTVFGEQKKLLRERIATTQTQLQQEVRVIPAAEIDHPRRVRILERLDEVDVALAGLAEQSKHASAEHGAAIKRLEDFETLAPELRRLELAAAQMRKAAEKLAESLSNLKTVERLNALNLSNVQILQPGTIDFDKVAPSRSRLVLTSGVLGLAAGLVLALLLAWFDRAVRSPLDVVRAELSCAAISAPVEVATQSLLDGRRNASKLYWREVVQDRSAPGCIVLVVAPTSAGSDASLVAADLATGLAHFGGDDVLLVDVGGAGQLAHAAPVGAAGWNELVAGTIAEQQACRTTNLSRLLWLPHGQSTTAPNALAAREVLCKLREGRRFLVLALADLEACELSLALAQEASGGMLVARSGVVTRDCLITQARMLEHANCRLLAVVVQN